MSDDRIDNYLQRYREAVTVAESGYVIARFFHFSSLFLITGSLCYLLLLTPVAYRAVLSPLLRNTLILCAWLVLGSGLAIFALQCVLMSGDSTAFWRPEIWSAVATTRFGQAWLPEILLSLLGILLVRGHWALSQSLLLLLAILQLLVTAMTGHAILHSGVIGVVGWLTVSLHLLAAALWVGGIYPLLLLMLTARKQILSPFAVNSMMNFSRVGHWAVALVVLTGIADVLLVAGWPPHFSGWWIGLMVKTLLVAVMITLAIINRYWLVPRFRQPSRRSQQWFICLTCIELLLAPAAIAAVSLFATLSPSSS